MNGKRKIHILGVGNNTAVYIDLVEVCGYEVAGLYHCDNTRVGEAYFGHRIIGSHDQLFESIDDKTFVAVSMGDNKIRQSVANKVREHGGIIPTLIHPNASVSPYADLDHGVVIHSGAVVQAGVRIGRDTVISYRSGISHTSTIKEACYIAVGATVGAYITIENLAFVGMGATLVSGKVKRVGTSATIGAGSLVLKDVDSYQIVAGMPAKPFTRL